MKVLFYLLIPLLLFAGCNRKVKNEITVIGHLKSTNIKEVSLKSYDLNLKAPVDSSGTFILKFVNNQPHAYQLEFNDNLNLFLIPGDSIIINKDGGDYKFSGGQSAVLSNYYIEQGKYWNKIAPYSDEKKYYSKEPNDFKKTVYMYLDSCEIPLNKLAKKLTNINPEFMRLEKERLKYNMVWDFLDYEYENYKKYTGQKPIIDESFHDYLKNINLNDSTLLQFEDYKGFLVSYIKYAPEKYFQNRNEISRDKYTETDLMLNSMFDEIKNQSVLDYVIHKVIYDRTNDLQVNDKNLAAFKKLCSNADYINEVENKYKELEVLMPGKPAPNFKLYDAKNKEYSLSDFKGKYLLIDVWGAFCEPCRKEAPYLNQIELDYRGKNIEFIGACFEKNSDIWLQRIKEMNLNGIQLIVKEAWDSQFRRDYQIYWVPTYILIDKEGRIIDSRAPRPSGNLRELLNKTLGTRI